MSETVHPAEFGAVTATSLGLGTLSTVNSPTPVANGGTGAATAPAARTALGVAYSPAQPPNGSVLRPWWLGMNASTALVEGTLYAVYLGLTPSAITVTNVKMNVAAAGAGTQTAEMGLASTPSAPNGSAQTLTKIYATGDLEALNGTGPKGVTTPFSQVVPAGTHLWACVRTAMSSTEPSTIFLMGDMGQGCVLTLTGASALTGLSSWTGSVVGQATNSVSGPLLIATYT